MLGNRYIQNVRYLSQDGYPILAMEIDGRSARLFSEIKPTILRHGLVFLGSEFAEVLPEIILAGTTLRGFTGDRTVFRLYLAFGLECYCGRFQEGIAREYPDPEEVRELGDRLADFATPDAPAWEELTAF